MQLTRRPHTLWRKLVARLTFILLTTLLVASGGIARPPLPSEATPTTSAAMLTLGSADLQLATPGHPVLSDGNVYVPATVDPTRPVPVLLGLHGMGGNGPRIAQRLRPCADQNGWVLATPTLVYRDYMDAEQTRLDDAEDIPQLKAMLDELPTRLGSLTLDPQVFVYGFSRGAQLAHRFALFYPDQVAGAAVVSAGSYTLPAKSFPVERGDKPLLFPYGLADLSKYTGQAFDPQALVGMGVWVGVGAADTAPNQVPPSWEPYLGNTRVDRARHFSAALRRLGADVSFEVFAGTGHEDTTLMRSRACDFLASQTPLHGRL